MTTDMVLDIAREALWLIIKCSAPMMLVSLVLGLSVSVFQTVTSFGSKTFIGCFKLSNFNIILLSMINDALKILFWP